MVPALIILLAKSRIKIGRSKAHTARSRETPPHEFPAPQERKAFLRCGKFF